MVLVKPGIGYLTSELKNVATVPGQDYYCNWPNLMHLIRSLIQFLTEMS
jgi:hypothetical protein